ncbi:MAG: Asp-tRNA(Asn)/Glu-tRNA(Gln) amidotransferase subunit GatC [Candidatus Cyclobacteriaceae bacterium M3_2C_046]
MKIDQQILRKIAHLARLDFEESDEESMIKDLTEILNWVEQLNEVDTEGIEPLTHMSDRINVYREDKVGRQLEHDKALKNAPKNDKDYFSVPKVIE